MAPMVDVVIVGAGAAGLGAARTARMLGLSFVVFEAMPRIGGRAYTSTVPFGIPWDLGCHWLHSASINPFRERADVYGFPYRSLPSPWRSRVDDHWATPAESREITETMERSHQAAMDAAKAGRDVAVSDVVDLDDPWLDFYRGSLAGEWGSRLDQVSTMDVYRYRDTDENYPLENGYGALVAWSGRDIPVELNTPVTAISWDGPRVKVTTGAGEVETGTVIITASTNAMAANLIRFTPELPDWKQQAFLDVPLGLANKGAVQVGGHHLGVEGHSSASMLLGNGRTIGFQLRPFGNDLANGYLAGPLLQDLEKEDDRALIDVTVSALKSMLGSDIKKHIKTTACSRWEREPWILGAYAAAKPGKANSRADLAKPLDGRLFFAGEAMHPEFFSTCHGADMSGVDAAHAVAKALGKKRASV